MTDDMHEIKLGTAYMVDALKYLLQLKDEQSAEHSLKHAQHHMRKLIDAEKVK